MALVSFPTNPQKRHQKTCTISSCPIYFLFIFSNITILQSTFSDTSNTDQHIPITQHLSSSSIASHIPGTRTNNSIIVFIAHNNHRAERSHFHPQNANLVYIHSREHHDPHAINPFVLARFFALRPASKNKPSHSSTSLTSITPPCLPLTLARMLAGASNCREYLRLTFSPNELILSRAAGARLRPSVLDRVPTMDLISAGV